MKRRHFVLGGVAVLALPLSAWARPITYPGGTNVMLGTNANMDMVHIDYTINRKWAVGWASNWYDEMDLSSHGPQVTRGWRWNHPDSQANVYLAGGAGPTQDHGQARVGAWSSLTADWENRRFFTQADTMLHGTVDGQGFWWQSARVGVAPYVAEAGQLHSWLMLQVDHTPGVRSDWSATPLIRQFWGDYLWEAGVNTRGGVLLNLMKTF